MTNDSKEENIVELPTTTKVTESIANIKQELQQTVPEQDLSGTGRQAVKEATEILSTIQTGLEDRNRDDLIQETVHRIEYAINVMGSKEYINAMNKLGREMIVLPGKMALEKLAHFTRVFFIHSQSRKLMSTVLDLVEDLIRTKDDKDLMDKLVDRFIQIFFDFKPLLREYVGQLKSLGNSIPDYSGTELSALDDKEREILQQAKEANKVAFDTFKKCFNRIFGASLDPLLNSVSELGLEKEDIETIQKFLDWFEHESRLESDKQDMTELRKQSYLHLSSLRCLFMEKFNQEKLEALRLESATLVDNIQKDPLFQSLATQSSQLVDTLLKDSQGNFTIKPELLDDLQVVLPKLFKKLARVPLPQIKVDKEDMEFCASNIQLSIEGLAPKQLTLSFISGEELGVADKRGELEGKGGQLCLIIKGITAEIKDFAIWFHRKKIPAIQDSGKADLAIKGMDVSFYLKQVSRKPVEVPKDQVKERVKDQEKEIEKITKKEDTSVKQTTDIKITKADCMIEQVYFRMFDTGHDWIYVLISPIIRMILKDKIQAEIKKALTELDLSSIL